MVSQVSPRLMKDLDMREISAYTDSTEIPCPNSWA
jgi:hypothetical protein